MILPNNSNIAIIAPSSGAASMFPGVFNSGLRNLKSMGYKLTVFPTCEMTSDELYKNPEVRANDINSAFADSSIDGIICSIGGYESIRILKYLDIDTIKNNPKPIMGFSDATTFLCYLSQLGLKTFYGPSVMAGFAQIHNDTSYVDRIKSFMQDEWTKYQWKASTYYVNGYKDWFKHDGSFLDKQDASDSFETFGQSFSGELWGGCIEVLEFMKGTKYWPKTEFFKDKVLFFETSEEKPSPDQVGYMLRNYAIQGILEQVSGIAFGRCKDYTKEEYNRLKEIVLDIYSVELKIPGNIVFNIDVGHTDPKWILPLGAVATFDFDKKVCLIEKV